MNSAPPSWKGPISKLDLSNCSNVSEYRQLEGLSEEQQNAVRALADLPDEQVRNLSCRPSTKPKPAYFFRQLSDEETMARQLDGLSEEQQNAVRLLCATNSAPPSWKGPISK